LTVFSRVDASARCAAAALLLLVGPAVTVSDAQGQQAPPQKPPAQRPATSQPSPQTSDKPGAAGTKKLTVGGFTRPWSGDLDGMIKRRLIRVATTYNRTHYFVDRGVQRGVVYEAFKLMEDELNAKLKTGNLRVNMLFVPMSRDQLLPAVAEGRADLAAAALTVTPERQKLVDFSIPTATDVKEIVVTGPGAPAIARVDDLAGHEVFVRESSSYRDSLVELNAKLKAQGKKEVVIKPAPESLETEDVLEMVNAGLVKITIADNHFARFWKELLPNIVLHEDVAVRSGGQLAVAMRKNSPQLMALANDWIKKHGPRTMFGNMMTQRYLKSTKFVKSATSEADLKRFNDIVAFFRKYGQQYNLDAALMAAQGYQESGLDQNVKSAVGAIGVMQVMPATGKELKVGDVTQLEPNIHAGIKYVRFMIDQYYAKEPMDPLNRGLFAFASYNVGPARIRQLRREAEKRGLDPNVWFNNVERIASERIGRETVTYVSNIYKYYIAYKLVVEEQERRKQDKTSF
jgi:membrane-bound lytic murein transglycosylase MltF